ncbi:MAG: Holliday junction resolvase RuvX [Flavobacteriales bacterium]|nr:Holliday junction resolvase RuvX [Flavobacteriales bacterium]|tara:strand:+ start:6122 stop:6535 length:414 start_codon:yes stop_codon:yes gene_type:complete
MSKIVAIDFGGKRCGIAETDSLQIIASGLTTVETKNLQDFMIEYLQKEDVECMVVGEPRRLNDEMSAIEKSIEPFINFIKKRFPKLKIEREDERFTSKMAMESMIAGGVKKMKRRDKALVDKVSATLILQSYMERMG